MSSDSWLLSLRPALEAIHLRPGRRLPNNHPLHIALRTYVLSLTLSLGPALLHLLTSRNHTGGTASRLKKILAREFSVTGFAFSLTTAVGGGSALDYAWQHMHEQDAKDPAMTWLRKLLSCHCLKPEHRTFLANAASSLIAIVLMQSRRPTSQTITVRAPMEPANKACRGRTSATLDLTLLFVVRAMDSLVQRICQQKHDSYTNGKESNDKGTADDVNSRRAKAARFTTKVDAFVFWAASARIMWCFFYQPERLPPSYVKWITSLARVDKRLLEVLRAIREKKWTYTHGSSTHGSLLTSMAADMGYPSSWGDPTIVPGTGVGFSGKVWNDLGVVGRNGLGGVPCELVHGRIGGIVGGSCLANAGVRGILGFLQALAIYAPVHFFPILLTRPQALLSSELLQTMVALMRSSLFLSTFISSIWCAICLTRTVLVARLLPRISHDFYDGPHGCILAGSLACGSSIWIENGRRRGEMALYVLPRAIRASVADAWLRGGSKSIKVTERLAFILSLATILSSGIHRPETLRGLTRWTLDFILKGPATGFWSRERRENMSRHNV